MSPKTIAQLRLEAQGIAFQKYNTLEATARYMGAMQGQNYYDVLWALGLRTRLTQQQIVKELENINVLRTWPQRGTIHLIPTKDAPWQVALSSKRMLRSMRRRRTNLGLDEKIFLKTEKIFTAALKGKQLLSRLQAMELLESKGISTKTGRGYHILITLALRGVLFIGPMEGKQQSIGLLQDWAPRIKISREKALAELCKRYFISHGPASLDDFCWWSGLTQKDGRLGLEMIQKYIKQIEVEGITYYYDKSIQVTPLAEEQAFLLPGFDEFMLGYKDRSAALPAQYAQKIVPGNNGMFLGTVVINGQVVGTWKRKRLKSKTVITLTSFKKLTRKEKTLLEVPLKVYADFLETTIETHLNE